MSDQAARMVGYYYPEDCLNMPGAGPGMFYYDPEDTSDEEDCDYPDEEDEGDFF